MIFYILNTEDWKTTSKWAMTFDFTFKFGAKINFLKESNHEDTMSVT